MDKQNNAINELYNVDILRARVLESIREYMSKPENETGDKITDMPQNMIDYMFSSCGRSVFGGMDLYNDILLLSLACVVYTDISTKYNKIVSVDGFGRFAGVAVEYVKTWQIDAKTASNKGLYLDNLISELYNLYLQYDFNYTNIFNNNNIFIGGLNGSELSTATKGAIFSRLHGYRENEIKNAFLSSKQQLGAVALVNKEFGWSADTVTQVERARALSLSDLPKINTYVNPQNTLETQEPL